MREIKALIDIHAPPGKIWDILMDFDNWHNWNPIVNRACGAASFGSTLNITMRGAHGEDAHHYNPCIIEMEDTKYFRWRTKFMAGLMLTNDKVHSIQHSIQDTHRLITAT